MRIPNPLISAYPGRTTGVTTGDLSELFQQSPDTRRSASTEWHVLQTLEEKHHRWKTRRLAEGTGTPLLVGTYFGDVGR